MTIKDIAKLAGVSPSTVSKIVNNKDKNINTETRNRVLKIVKEFNYTAYSSTIQSSSAKKFILGVLLKSTSKYSRFIQAILETAQANGYSVLLCDSLNSLTEETKNITMLCKNNIDGLIWEPVNESSLLNEHYFKQKEIPINYMNCPFINNSQHIDFIQMSYDATNELIKHQHTEIACLIKENSVRSEMVIEGFKRCLYDNRITYSDNMVFSSKQSNYSSEILLHNFTAVVSSHYTTALQLRDNFEKSQYKIPNDLSLVCLKDNTCEDLPFPKLSYIKIPYYEFGCFITSDLIKRCEKNQESTSTFHTNYTVEDTSSIDLPNRIMLQKIIIVGSIHIDRMLSVDELPGPGRTIRSNSSFLSPGGKGINQAVGVAKLNHPAVLIGRVGNDYESTLIYNSLAEHDINVQGITRDSSAETGKAFIHVGKDGESTITIISGANQNLSPQDIQAQSRLFVNATYCLLQSEIPMDSIMETLKIAKKHGVKTIFKPAALESVHNDLMQNIDIFIPNKKEAELLCPHLESLEDKTNYFLNKGVGTVIITLGHDGCYFKTKEISRHFPSVPIKVVDTTGAADAFISALAVYLSCGYSLEKAIQVASYAAAFCVNRQGVVSALIDRSSLETYIKSQDKDLI
jgi:ribokinase